MPVPIKLPARGELKLEGNKIMHFTGQKWLVQETAVDNNDKKSHEAMAKKRMIELKKMKVVENRIFWDTKHGLKLIETCYDRSDTPANVKKAKKRFEELTKK